MGEFRMPALGAGMDEGRLIAWYVAVGDEVHRGQLIALVETDKATIDVEVFEDGVIEVLLIEEGTKVPVGTPLATIASSAASAPAAAADVAPVSASATAEQPATPEQPASATAERSAAGRIVSPLVRREVARCGVDPTRLRGTGVGGVVTRHDVEVAVARTVRGHRSSPYARCLARDRGIDPDTLRGTGPDGVVVARDVPAPTPTPAPAAPATMSAADRALAMRQAIARAMERANRDIPHYHLGETVDVEPALVWLAERNADRRPADRILPAVLVLKAVALALRDVPDLNGYWIDDGFEPGDGIHLGVAINLRRGGLLAPAIRDTDERSVEDLMGLLRDLVTRTRAGGLRGSELTDPTITVSNLGDTGVDTIHGVITPPQVALVGAGRITRRAWVVDDDVRPRRTIALSLAGDHRASDGHRGARLLTTIATHLARPETL